MKDALKDAVVEALHEVGRHVWDGLKQTLIQSTGEIALIGGGISVILKVAGWDKGFKVAGILFVVHVLVRYLLG